MSEFFIVAWRNLSLDAANVVVVAAGASRRRVANHSESVQKALRAYLTRASSAARPAGRRRPPAAVAFKINQLAFVRIKTERFFSQSSFNRV